MRTATRRALSATFAGALLLGAGACGDDDAVDVDVDEEQLQDDMNETGEDIKEGADEVEDTIDENVDLGGDAEDQGD